MISASVQAAALRAAFPSYAVSVLRQRGERPRFELVSRYGPSCAAPHDWPR